MVAWAAAHSAWGKVVETYAHPIGELNRRRKVDSPFRLLGQVADEDTGLCWTRFRCFDPEVGRWCSPDPLGIDGGSDLFAFDGSPTLVVDLLGLATGSPHGSPPPNMSPSGAGRRGAFREAKRRNGIPVSQQPAAVGPNLDRRRKVQPGRQYEFNVAGREDPITIRDDAGGHYFGPNDPQNRGPHFNDEAGDHYDY
jgi:RHS repeat-associated protein